MIIASNRKTFIRWEVSDHQNFNARIQENIFSKKKSPFKGGVSIEILMEESKPVVTEQCDLEDRVIIQNYRSFCFFSGTSGERITAKDLIKPIPSASLVRQLRNWWTKSSLFLKRNSLIIDKNRNWRHFWIFRTISLLMKRSKRLTFQTTPP